MNGIEFKLLIRGLFLTNNEAKEIGGYKDNRQIRRFASGGSPPHDDLVEMLNNIDSRINRCVSETVRSALASNVKSVKLLVYTCNDDYFEFCDDAFDYLNLHHCLISRTKMALQRLDIDVKLVEFDVDDCSSSRSVWTVDKTDWV